MKAVLFLMLLMGFSTAYGSYYQQYGYNNTHLGSGWFVGVYGAFDTFYMNARDNITDATEENTERYELIQRAPGGGGFVGWACGFCDRFSIALIGAGTGYASHGEHIFLDSDSITGDLFHNESRVRYTFDFFAQPGALIGDCLLLYFKFGASVLGVRQKYEITDNDSPFELLNRETTKDHEWGYVFGSGAVVAISSCLRAFTEVVWHSYPSHISNTIPAITGDETNDFQLKSQLTRIFSFGFRAGIGFAF